MLNYPSTLKLNDRGNVFKSERDRKRATSRVELRPLTTIRTNNESVLPSSSTRSSSTHTPKNNNDKIINSKISINTITNNIKKIKDLKMKDIKKKKYIIMIVCFIILTTLMNHINLSSYIENRKQNMNQEEIVASTTNNNNNNNYVPEEQNDEEKQKRINYIYEALKKYSSVESLNNKQSYQYKALEWISTADGYNIKPQHPKFLQRYVLALLYYSTNGPTSWKNNKKFLTPFDECSWKDNGGVRNCNEEGFVTDLSLWNNLHGTLPSEIGYLTSLKTLYLSRNKITGTLPSEIGNLHQLTYLGLQHNKIKGTIPEDYFGNLKQLKYLMLEKNDLSGTIQKIGPICQLLEKEKLQMFTSDCRTLVDWREPEIACFCCTKCYLP